MRKHILLTFFMAFLLSLTAAPHVASAGLFGLFGDDDDDKMEFIVITPENFKEQTEVFNDVPFGKPELEYKVNLPKDWVPRKISTDQGEINPKLLGDIARILGPPVQDVRPWFIVQVIEIDNEIRAIHWLQDYMLKNGYVTKEETEVSETEANSMYVFTDDGNAFVVRATAQIHGNMVIFARLAVPVLGYQILQHMQDLSLKSFKMVSPARGRIEKRRTFSMMNALRFKYPLSWMVQNANFGNTERLSVELHSQDSHGNLAGLIRFRAYLKGKDLDMKEEEKIVREKLAENGINLSEVLETHEPELSRRGEFKLVKQEVYTVTFDQAYIDQEFWLTQIEGDDFHYFIEMLTPARGEQFYDWARNSRTLELILRSIK